MDNSKNSLLLLGMGIGIGCVLALILVLMLGATPKIVKVGPIEFEIPTVIPPTGQPTLVQQAAQQPTATSKLATSIPKIPPTPTPIPSLQPTATLRPVLPTATAVVVSGKYPCPLVIKQSEVDSWKVGQTTVPIVHDAVGRFDAKRPDDAGAFMKGTKIPSGVLVATNFDERDESAWTRYPVIPIVHSGSWGLFQTTGEYTAPNAGACMTIIQ